MEDKCVVCVTLLLPSLLHPLCKIALSTQLNGGVVMCAHTSGFSGVTELTISHIIHRGSQFFTTFSKQSPASGRCRLSNFPQNLTMHYRFPFAAPDPLPSSRFWLRPTLSPTGYASERWRLNFPIMLSFPLPQNNI